MHPIFLCLLLLQGGPCPALEGHVPWGSRWGPSPARHPPAALVGAFPLGDIATRPGAACYPPPAPPARFASPRRCPGTRSPARSSPAAAHPSGLCRGAGSDPSPGRGSCAPPAALPGAFGLITAPAFPSRGSEALGMPQEFPQPSLAVHLSCLPPPRMHHHPGQGVPPSPSPVWSHGAAGKPRPQPSTVGSGLRWHTHPLRAGSELRGCFQTRGSLWPPSTAPEMDQQPPGARAGGTTPGEAAGSL